MARRGAQTLADTTSGARRDSSNAHAAQRDMALFSLLEDATVFMRANQIPLLLLARLDAVCTSDGAATRPCPNDRLSDADTWVPPSLTRTMIQYVAFNDADDLLGYDLTPYLSSTGTFGTMVNVTVMNPARRFFGFFRHPGDAHTRSDENPAVLDAIAQGFKIEGPALPPSESRGRHVGPARRAP